MCHVSPLFLAKLGGIRRFTSGLSLTTPKLTVNALQQLLDKKIYALVIPNFIDKEVCGYASKKLLTNKIQEYTNAPGIGRVGIAFYETTNNPEMEKAYFDEAHKNLDVIRSVFSPYHAPIDKLRVVLDEIWHPGANLDTRDRKMFVGLCRSLENGRNILPHEDVLERDDPKNSAQSPLKVQLACNVYLQTSQKGGELELYDKSYQTAEYDKLRGDSYGIRREWVPPVIVKITPNVGDLILFNGNNLHSVSLVEGIARLSIGCFIGYRSQTTALKVWS